MKKLLILFMLIGLFGFTNLQESQMRYIDFIAVHCSYSKPSMDIGVKEIRQWHLDRGWKDIGYHFVIKRDGTIEEGLPLEEIGRHIKGVNDHSIGICMVGGMNENGDVDTNFTFEQYVSLKSLLNDLMMRFTNARIGGHREYSIKPCPTFDVVAFINIK